MRKVGSGVLLTAALAAGCAGASPSEPRNSNVRLGVWAPDAGATLLLTEVSGLENPTYVVVGDRDTWLALWTQAWAGNPTPPPLPQIDFVLNSVLVVALGRRGGAGFSVSIDSVVTTTAGALLYATTLSPGAGCNASGAASSPVHMVHSPGHPPVNDWRITEVLHPCAP